MNCPRCQRPLTTHQAPRFTMFACTGCGGMWLDGAASRTVVAAVDPVAMQAADHVARAAEQAVDVNAQAACPQCRHAMEKMPIPAAGVVVDTCREHGVWFDRNELQQVVRAVASPGTAAPQPPAPPPYNAAPQPPPYNAAPPAAVAPAAPAQNLPPGMLPGQYVAPGWTDGQNAGQPAASAMQMPQAGPPIGGMAPGMSPGQYQAPGWADPQTGQLPQPQQQGQPWSTAKTALAVGAGVAAVGGLAYVATHTDAGRSLLNAVTGDTPPNPYGGPPPQQGWQQPQGQGSDFGSIGQVLSKLF
ncbi:MAG: zf-TFIIB domain-containing protein [Myxococcales bacterium]|nr:zf-TFIIB domain-containing protein [Myxococcales bacterium]